MNGPNRAQQMNGPNRAQMNPLEWAQQMNGPNRAQQMNGPNRAQTHKILIDRLLPPRGVFSAEACKNARLV